MGGRLEHSELRYRNGSLSAFLAFLVQALIAFHGVVTSGVYIQENGAGSLIIPTVAAVQLPVFVGL